ncbi:DsbA family protein [Actibacterium lipolyticum]|uniref:Protein disulfide isomerase II DsbC n=1 Tax=Actibacterium lipolyticum TaxID=1524263 RepID=A0A238KJB6_9RHOB|nr:DsbA family protein [Actibacterium lipolyticum]SMX42788.1 protein disulfide isomerase II DsbC [Actibacterium lipolyticum]
MKRQILAGAFAALAFAAPAQALDIGAMSDAERELFRAEIRAYLLDNPEVLMEAIGVLEERQAGEQANNDAALLQTNAAEIFNDDYSWVGGNLDGDITLVEFIDYRCGYCRKAHDEVAELIKTDGNIRFVVKEFPILGEESDLSARFAIATLQVAGDDAYKSAHDALITFRGNVNIKNLEKLAGRLGLNPDDILPAMNSPEVDAVIAANRALAQRLAISGTPTFVMDDQMLRGYVPLANMREIAKSVRAN